MVPGAGIEPARGFPRGILSPLRLPIPPPGRVLLFFLVDILLSKEELASLLRNHYEI